MNPLILTINGRTPKIHPSAFIAPGAVISGEVEIGPEASVWYGASIRAEFAPIKIGARTSVQENCVLHTSIEVGDDCTVGHGSILHGCQVSNGVLIGMGAIVLDGAQVGAEAMIAAGALVIPGMQVPPRTLVAGNPGKVRRELTAEELATVREGTLIYLRLRELHRDPSLVYATPLPEK